MVHCSPCWFTGGRKTGVPSKKTLGVKLQPTTNTTHIWHWWEESVLTTAQTLLPNKQHSMLCGSSKRNFCYVFGNGLQLKERNYNSAYKYDCLRISWAEHLCCFCSCCRIKKKINLGLQLLVLGRMFFFCVESPVDITSLSRVEHYRKRKSTLFLPLQCEIH